MPAICARSDVSSGCEGDNVLMKRSRVAPRLQVERTLLLLQLFLRGTELCCLLGDVLSACSLLINVPSLGQHWVMSLQL